jgi:signal peptidase
MAEEDSAIRDLLVALLVVGGILLALFLYTGNWPPPVVVESNSMMHVDAEEYNNNFGDTRTEDVPYGRVGTIDPGDLVLVKQFEGTEGISTFADQADEHYGRPGEVVVYFPGGDERRTPIIHRAMTYVETTEEGDTSVYEVRWHEDWKNRNVGCESPGDRECTEPGDCGEDERGRLTCTFEHGFRIPALFRRSGQHIYQPNWSGFLTQGDNPENAAPDQILFDRGPIKEEWTKGVARGELPWFGLIKLAMTGEPGNTVDVRDHPYYVTLGAMTAPRDLWIMLVVGLGVVAFAPVGVDYGIHLVRRRLMGPPDEPPEEPPTSEPGSTASSERQVEIDLE